MSPKMSQFPDIYAIDLLDALPLPLSPAVGAGTFDSLLAQHIGWNLNLHFLLDSDVKGGEELERYKTIFLARDEDFSQLSDLCPGVQEIEDLLDDEGREIIRVRLGMDGKLSKKAIHRFLQERLAAGTVEPLGSFFAEKSRLLIEALRGKLPGS